MLDLVRHGHGNFLLHLQIVRNTATNSNLIGAGINAVNLLTANNGIAPTNATAGIPFTTGFDLGIIGDIIMHKGRSFISLGSLVNALEADTDSQKLS